MRKLRRILRTELWRIARSPSATPIDGSSTVAMKVARPSGKLWSAIATAVSAPIFLSCAFCSTSEVATAA